MGNFWKFKGALAIGTVGMLVLQLKPTWANIASQDPVVIQEDLMEKSPAQKKSLTYSLEATLKEETLGIDVEDEKAKVALLTHARAFRKLRQGSHRNREREKFLQGCNRDPMRQPFCLVLRSSDRSKERNRSNGFHGLVDRTSIRQGQVASWLRQASLANLGSTSDKDIRGGFKKISSSEELEQLSTALISSSSCQYASLRQILGSKLEEYLPDSQLQNKLIQLYEKAANCESGESSQKARFRLSLHYVWQDKCKDALPQFDRLIAQSESNDYRSRALFWKLSCVEKLGDEVATQKTRKALSERYPFSFHTILAQKENSAEKLPIQPKSDSRIVYRSKNSPEINDYFRVIEALLSIHEEGLAREVIGQVEDDLGATEPQFRLYAGVLYHRMNFHLKNFRLLSSIFRENPEFISKPALELYYPQNAIKAHQVPKTGIDENLILSLVRQESAFNANAKSSAGALGLMQVMPATAKRMERFQSRRKLLEPAFNLKIGSKYFSILLNRYNGDAELALAAYNAGPKRVDDWLKRYPVQDRILFLDLIPFNETREYVAAIARNYFWYVNLYPEAEWQAKEQVADRSLGQVFRLLGG